MACAACRQKQIQMAQAKTINQKPKQTATPLKPTKQLPKK
jgi:hypothetical protein